MHSLGGQAHTGAHMHAHIHAVHTHAHTHAHMHAHTCSRRLFSCLTYQNVPENHSPFGANTGIKRSGKLLKRKGGSRSREAAKL